MAVTIHDVARRAGVASSTVSRYVNGYRLREKNRGRVEQAIQDLGFKANLIAKGLKRSRLMSIAVIVPHYTIFFMTSIIILERILVKENYSLLLGCFEEDPRNLPEKMGFAEERYVSGLILYSAGLGAESIPILQQYIDKKIPIVLVEQAIPGFETDVVKIDNAHASFRAVEKLILDHHTRIAIVSGGNEQRYICQERFSGYSQAMRTYNLPISPDWIVWGEFVDAGEYGKIQKILESPHPPTAIYATTYYATIGTMITLHQLHLKIPDDISLIGFDHFDPVDAIEPPLTLVEQPLERMAHTAADLLLKRIKGDYTDFPQRIEFDTKMLVRDSVRQLSRETLNPNQSATNLMT